MSRSQLAVLIIGEPTEYVGYGNGNSINELELSRSAVDVTPFVAAGDDWL